MPSRLPPPRKWRTVLYPLADYRYFAEPPEFDSSASVGRLNLLKAAWMADAAMLAYGRSGEQLLGETGVQEILRELGGFTEVETLGDWSGGAKGAQGYLAMREEFAVLAFRGTEADDWRDFAANLATWPVHEEGARVHRGFKRQLDSLWAGAAEGLARYRERSSGEIFFTGHSLGAALATIAASRFGGGNASVYTFGAPRVGNLQLAEAVEANTSAGHFRLVDRSDLVPRVPPGIFGYAHPPATLYRIELDGGIQDRTGDHGHAGGAEELSRDLKCLAEVKLPIQLEDEPPSDLYDHGPGCYCTGIWNVRAG